MPYKLKPNAPEFDVVDGPFAGKKYRHGEIYPDVPPGDKGRFEAVGAKSLSPAPKPAKTVAPPAKKNGVSEDDNKASVKTPAKGGSKK